MDGSTQSGRMLLQVTLSLVSLGFNTAYWISGSAHAVPFILYLASIDFCVAHFCTVDRV